MTTNPQPTYFTNWVTKEDQGGLIIQGLLFVRNCAPKSPDFEENFLKKAPYHAPFHIQVGQ
jgi:hypothetical protein